jgi:formate dehydrogenase assembly factor FdhD
MGNQAVKEVSVRRYKGSEAGDAPDILAVEEPLEIRLEYGPEGSAH